MEVFARMSNLMNVWEFPFVFKWLEPKWWNDASLKQMVDYKPARVIRFFLNFLSTEEERSRLWWTEHLGRSEKEWRKWWDSEGGCW